MMSTVRRWYIYLVSAVSLQAVAWAIIVLLRNLLITRLNPPSTLIAFPIAVILVGLPIFLAHWLWGQRLAGSCTCTVRWLRSWARSRPTPLT
jgi:hypothetical protein